MVIFYGSKDIKKTMAITGPTACKSCQRVTPMNIERDTTFFTLFWVPLIPYHSLYTQECPECGFVEPLDKDLAKSLISKARGE